MKDFEEASTGQIKKALVERFRAVQRPAGKGIGPMDSRKMDGRADR